MTKAPSGTPERHEQCPRCGYKHAPEAYCDVNGTFPSLYQRHKFATTIIPSDKCSVIVGKDIYDFPVQCGQPRDSEVHAGEAQGRCDGSCGVQTPHSRKSCEVAAKRMVHPDSATADDEAKAREIVARLEAHRYATDSKDDLATEVSIIAASLAQSRADAIARIEAKRDEWKASTKGQPDDYYHARQCQILAANEIIALLKGK